MKTYFNQTINVLFSQESSFYFDYLERNSVCSKLKRGHFRSIKMCGNINKNIKKNFRPFVTFGTSSSTFFQVELEVKSSSNEKKIVCRNSIPNPEALIDEMTVKTSKKNDCHQEDVKISRCSVCVCEPKMAAVWTT